MSLFGIEAEKSKEVFSFISDTNKRLKNNNYIENPFNGRVITLPDKFLQTTQRFIFDLEPIWPKFYKVGFYVLIIPMFFEATRTIWWALPGVLIFSTGFFWSSRFHYLILKLGLKKAGYKGKVKLLKQQAIIKELLRIHYPTKEAKEL